MIKTKKRNKGFSFIELIVVIAIIGIMFLIFSSFYMSYIEKAKLQACNINCLQIQRNYTLYLIFGDKKDSEATFIQFVQENVQASCPSGGEISYKNGRVECSVHITDEKVSSDEEDKSVPFL